MKYLALERSSNQRLDLEMKAKNISNEIIRASPLIDFSEFTPQIPMSVLASFGTDDATENFYFCFLYCQWNFQNMGYFQSEVLTNHTRFLNTAPSSTGCSNR